MSTDIKIITEPTVRLVGRLAIDEIELAGFLADEGVETWTTDAMVAGEKLVEVAGRLCYKSYARPRPGGNAAYLGHILEVAHGSVVEHQVFNLVITGVSRSLTHEWVRHRAGFAYSQRSQRFVDEGEGRFVVPPGLDDEVAAAREWARSLADHGYGEWGYEDLLVGLREGKVTAFGVEVAEPSCVVQAGLLWLASVEAAQRAYGRLSNYLVNRALGDLDHGFAKPFANGGTEVRKPAREAARSLLPNATETQIFVTVNARAARHFIEARGDAAADAEIRRVAVALLRILQAESPNLFGDYSIADHPAGGEVVSTPHRKV